MLTHCLKPNGRWTRSSWHSSRGTAAVAATAAANSGLSTWGFKYQVKYEHYCFEYKDELDVVSSNPSRVELWVRGISVLSRT